MRVLAFICSAWLAPALALAQPANLQAYLTGFVEGCVPSHTFQMRNCSVQHFYSCGDGSLRLITAIQNVLVSAETYGPGMQPQAWMGLDGPGQMQARQITDPFDMRVLRETGQDLGELVAAVDVGYFAGDVRMTQNAVLDGTAVQANGDVFLVGKMETRMFMPAPYGTFELDYDLYVGRDIDVLAASLSRVSQAGQTQTYPSGLVEILKSQDAGFLQNSGRHDCAG